MGTLNVKTAKNLILTFTHNKGEGAAKLHAVAPSGTALDLTVCVTSKVVDGSLQCLERKIGVDESVSDQVDDYLKDCVNLNKNRTLLTFKSFVEFLKCDARRHNLTGESWEDKAGNTCVYAYGSK